MSKPTADYRIDGQTVTHYHTKEGEAARLKAIRIANEDGGCYPPCGGSCCVRVREFMATAEFCGPRAPIPLFRCKACGAAGKPVDLEWDGKVVGTFSACQACVDRTTTTLSRVRPVFDAMIAAGIDRDLANEAMQGILEDPRFKE